ncbi:30S ribosomal protein S15 [Candidatus Falkowbacteria bacterium]|nr:30S ribosomal protein S15 [Candidatus Falkowbacteria bacterium]
MMLDKKTKQKVINKFKIHATDTGSSQVQIAILTEEIKQLTEHLKKHKHDHSSRRGLLKKVSERRRLLKYLQKEDAKVFDELAKILKLKIAKKMIEDEEARQKIEDEILAKQEAKAEAAELAEEKRVEEENKNNQNNEE